VEDFPGQESGTPLIRTRGPHPLKKKFAWLWVLVGARRGETPNPGQTEGGEKPPRRVQKNKTPIPDQNVGGVKGKQTFSQVGSFSGGTSGGKGEKRVVLPEPGSGGAEPSGAPWSSLVGEGSRAPKDHSRGGTQNPNHLTPNPHRGGSCWSNQVALKKKGGSFYSKSPL